MYTVGVMGSQSHRSSRGSDTSSAYSGSDTMHSVRSSDQVSISSRFCFIAFDPLQSMPVAMSNESANVLFPDEGGGRRMR